MGCIMRKSVLGVATSQDSIQPAQLQRLARILKLYSCISSKSSLFAKVPIYNIGVSSIQRINDFIIGVFSLPDLPYRDCTIENICDVSHDTKLYSLALPPGCRMCVPLGYHVHIRHTVEGIYICLLHSFYT